MYILECIFALCSWEILKICINGIASTIFIESLDLYLDVLHFLVLLLASKHKMTKILNTFRYMKKVAKIPLRKKKVVKSFNLADQNVLLIANSV